MVEKFIDSAWPGAYFDKVDWQAAAALLVGALAALLVVWLLRKICLKLCGPCCRCCGNEGEATLLEEGQELSDGTTAGKKGNRFRGGANAPAPAPAAARSSVRGKR